ncbi:MAG TPA: hypothetical protein VKV73_31280 [Chloroflexota bacterium]|nr:hypothetical protein [Chloroflexota bacterium]
MIEEHGATTHGTPASSLPDDALSSLLGRRDQPTPVDQLGVEVDCFPLHGVSGAAPAPSGTLHTRSADLARDVLARAEREVRDLLAQDPLAPDWANRSAEIVARAKRQVSQVLAEGRNDAEVCEPHAEAGAPTDNHIDSDESDRAGAASTLIHPDPGDRQPQSVENEPAGLATDQSFATLRAVVLPAEPGALRYRVSGQLTLATMLAFQYAVSRLPGVDSARVDPEPKDIAVLSMMTTDSALVHRQLERMSAVCLQMDPA